MICHHATMGIGNSGCCHHAQYPKTLYFIDEILNDGLQKSTSEANSINIH